MSNVFDTRPGSDLKAGSVVVAARFRVKKLPLPNQGRIAII